MARKKSRSKSKQIKSKSATAKSVKKATHITRAVKTKSAKELLARKAAQQEDGRIVWLTDVTLPHLLFSSAKAEYARLR
jgi:hypothetical protein